MKSASPITGVDINENVSDLARKVGLDNFVKDIDEIEPANVIIDTTGIPKVISKAFEKLALVED